MVVDIPYLLIGLEDLARFLYAGQYPVSNC